MKLFNTVYQIKDLTPIYYTQHPNQSHENCMNIFKTKIFNNQSLT